jgi:outer membrane biosynthesis protein TonB
MRIDRVDGTAAAIAVVGHGAILAALIYGLGKASVEIPPQPSIEVSFVEEVGAISAGETTEASAPPAAAAEPTPPVEAAEPETAPTPAPRPAPSPLTVRQPPPRPQPRQESRPQAQPQPRPPARPQPRRPLTEEALGGFGNDPAARNTRPAGAVVTNQARASMDAAILRALLPCQRQPLPAPQARQIRVRVEVTLRADGGLASARVMSVANSDPDLRIYEQRMRDLAVNVIEQCAPIRGLPAEYYNVPRGWRTFRYVFPNS